MEIDDGNCKIDTEVQTGIGLSLTNTNYDDPKLVETIRKIEEDGKADSAILMRNFTLYYDTERKMLEVMLHIADDEPRVITLRRLVELIHDDFFRDF